MTTRPIASRAAAALVCAAVLGATSTVGAAADPVSPEVSMAERTNPAVQLVETTFDAKVSLRQVTLDGDGLQLFHAGVVKLQAGELRDADQAVGWIFQRMRRNPTAYLHEVGERRTKRYSDAYRGSGFLATPDGYLVTARHVVTADSDVKKTFVDEGAQAFGRADARGWLKAFRQSDLSDESIQSISDTFAAYAAAKVQVQMSAPKVSVVLGTADADGSRVGKSYPADVAYRSSGAVGEDVAVVRVHLDAQLPALPLATTEVVQGDHLYLDGFPALPDGSEAALLQPTLTSGQVTAIKDNGSGIRQPQTDATASGGSSGGPALNDSGQVVGILVSGAVDGKGGSLGQQYLMPLGSVRDALARSGATPDAGQTTALYDDALDDFWANHYVRSLDEFRQVRDLFPAHAYAGSYIARAQAAIAAGKDVPVRTVPWLPIGVGAGALVLGSVVGLLVLRRPRHPRAGADPASTVDGAGPAPVPTPEPHVLPAWGDLVPAPVGAVAAVSTAGAQRIGEGPVDPVPAGEPVVVEPVASATGDDVDEIPDWEPIDYVAAFPTADDAPTADR